MCNAANSSGCYALRMPVLLRTLPCPPPPHQDMQPQNLLHCFSDIRMQLDIETASKRTFFAPRWT